MTPRVSVVIPCFNLGAYLDEAVQSVLDQTFQDFEIVIVDDGSDEAVTQLLLSSYQRPKTRVLRAPHGGVARTRNRGLHEARGRYVSFLDADDAFEGDYLAKAVQAIEADPRLAFVSCWLTAFGQAEFSWTPERCDFPQLLAEDTVCTAALMRSDILRAVGGFDDDPRIDGYEDWELPVRLVARGHRGAIIPEFLFRYRIRADSKSAARTTPENHASVVEYMLTKHAGCYRRHAAGVLEVIDHRIEELEEVLHDPPRRPDRVDDWRAAIVVAERHRRDLEELTRGPQTPRTDTAVDWGSLRRLEPVSRIWGLDRGRAVDRYYIERFLQEHAGDVSGHVLEVKDATYAHAYGSGLDAVDVVDIAAENPDATIVADLAAPNALPHEHFDCFILTQTIHVIYAVESVIHNAYAALRPGGVLLATLPCLSRIDYESGIDGDFWRFTPASARRLFGATFGDENVEVESWGNVLVCTAFLQGLAVEDLTPEELDHGDPYFPLLLTVRTVKRGAESTTTDASAVGRPTVDILEVVHVPPAPGLAGGHIDAPRAGAAYDFPWLDVAGWALSPDGPVEAVELVHAGEVFRRSPPGARRPDVAAAFPDVPGAAAAGFSTRVSMLGLAGRVDLEVIAVCRGGLRAPIGRVQAGLPSAGQAGARVAALLVQAEPAAELPPGVLGQDLPSAKLWLCGPPGWRSGPIGHPGIHWLDTTAPGLPSIVPEEMQAEFVWPADSGPSAASSFLRLAAAALARDQDAAFATDGTRQEGDARIGALISVLSGSSLGSGVVFRSSAVRLVGGFDPAAVTPSIAAWDLAIRLLAAGRRGIAFGDGGSEAVEPLAESVPAAGLRWLYRRHRDLFANSLADVFLDREESIRECLHRNEGLERLLSSELEPTAAARQWERDRVGGKLRDSSRLWSRHGQRPAVDWGDFRRFTPLGPVGGSDRGLPVESCYIERFLTAHVDDLGGRVSEIPDLGYVRRLTGAEPEENRALAAIALGREAPPIGDLAASTLDCVVLTHVLQHSLEPNRVIAACSRVLKAGGVLLLTVPGVRAVDATSIPDRDLWRFTSEGLSAILRSAFRVHRTEVRVWGNRIATIASLEGLAVSDLEADQLDPVDPEHPLLVTARVVAE